MTQNNTPRLRFKEFSGEWEEKTINQILTIGSGRDYKHLKKGEIPVYGTGGLMTMVNDFLHDGETVCIGRKGTIDKPFFYKGKIWTVDTLFYTHSYVNALPKFVYNLFLRVNWKEHNEASGVPSLSKSTIEKIKLALPTLPEQTKIADFLSSVDSKLTLLTTKKNALIQYKKGVMQQIFSQEIRFKNEDGNDYPDWEEKTLGDVGDVKMCKRIFNEETSPLGEIPFYKIGSFGKKADAYISKELYFNYRERFSFPKKGDILISAAGTIGRTVVYNGEDAYYQDSNIVWIANDNNTVLNQFLFYILQIVKYNTEGGTIQRLYNSILKSIKFSCPSLPEQTKIATFLTSLDGKINAMDQQIEKVKDWKKGLLQGMFV